MLIYSISEKNLVCLDFGESVFLYSRGGEKIPVNQEMFGFGKCYR
jgi:hypothetical protein